MTWVIRFTQPVIVYSEPGAVLVKGEGAYPELVQPSAPPGPPPGTAIPFEGDVPPIGPIVLPPEDTAPYAWPTDGPRYQVRDQDRTQWTYPIPGAPGLLYVQLPDAGNPAISSYKNAGIIQAGRFAGSRLWAPPDAPPALLRRIIHTGSDT